MGPGNQSCAAMLQPVAVLQNITLSLCSNSFAVGHSPCIFYSADRFNSFIVCATSEWEYQWMLLLDSFLSFCDSITIAWCTSTLSEGIFESLSIKHPLIPPSEYWGAHASWTVQLKWLPLYFISIELIAHSINAVRPDFVFMFWSESYQFAFMSYSKWLYPIFRCVCFFSPSDYRKKVNEWKPESC